MLVSFAYTLGLETIARLLETRHFRTQLQPDVFNVKGTEVLLNRFSKLKRILFEKSSIFHLPGVGFKTQCKFSEIFFRTWTPYYKSPFFFILGSICRYIIHLQKAARRFLGFGFWKAGKQVLSAQPDQFEPYLLLL